MNDLQATFETSKDPAPPHTICDRCGSFASTYTLWRMRRCEACLARRDPIETGPITARSLAMDSLRLSARVALPATLGILVVGSVSALLGLSQQLVVRVFDALVMTLATATIQRLAFARVVYGPGASVGEALKTTLRRYGSVWGARFLANLSSAIFALLLIVPGVLRALSYTMNGVMVLNEGVDAMDSLELSEQRMAGHRKATFLALLLLGLVLLALVGAILVVTVLIPAVQGIVIEEDSLAMELLTTNAMYVGLIPSYVLPVVLQLKLAVPQPVRPAAIPFPTLNENSSS